MLAEILPMNPQNHTNQFPKLKTQHFATLWLLSRWLQSMMDLAYCCNQAPVVRRLHNAIHPINHYPRDSVTYLSNNAGQPSKPNLRKSWIVRQEANSIFFNINTENKENILWHYINLATMPALWSMLDAMSIPLRPKLYRHDYPTGL